MKTSPNVYITGRAPAPSPLERYLPPVPVGVITKWLQDNVPKGSWVLEPFGAAPRFAAEAARAGYLVAVAANNPIARFLLELHAQPPSVEELTAILAELGAARRGEERLEQAILDLYITECPNCHKQSPAQAFIWEREAVAPLAKILHCSYCGAQGEYPTDEADKQRAEEFQKGGPHISRALERIAPKDDPDREHAEEALEAYLPRAVYALFTIINRIDGLTLTESQRRLTSALVLSACDRANKLWAHPSGRSRPKQLSAPARFREYNLWYEMERSIALWAQPLERVPVLPWPQEPPSSGGISLFEGRLREMTSKLSKLPLKAAFTAFPRPTQAFWTLCALWAGWLWGREAIGQFALVLRRKRYDWAWHCEALHSGLSALSDQVAENTPLFGIVTESETGFNAAAEAAANLAGFRLEAQAFRLEEEQLQVHWRKAEIKKGTQKTDTAETVRSAASQVLLKRGHPSHLLHLQAAALSELGKQARLSLSSSNPGDLFAELRSTIEVGLTFRGSFLRFGGSEQSLETGLWWLLDTRGSRSPLADRVEIATVRHLLRKPPGKLDDIEETLCAIFPGLLTPAKSLIEAALNSYGEEIDGIWRLAAADQPRARRSDLSEIRAGLVELGTRLGYRVSGDAPMEWKDDQGNLVLCFYVIASAVLGEILLKANTPPARSLVVLPGRRARLALYKIERDPRFQQAIADGWRFIKYRHVRRLVENKSLTPATFNELLELDPLTLETMQAPLL